MLEDASCSISDILLEVKIMLIEDIFFHNSNPFSYFLPSHGDPVTVSISKSSTSAS